jgi:hypothetical protein
MAKTVAKQFAQALARAGVDRIRGIGDDDRNGLDYPNGLTDHPITGMLS